MQRTVKKTGRHRAPRPPRRPRNLVLAGTLTAAVVGGGVALLSEIEDAPAATVLHEAQSHETRGPAGPSPTATFGSLDAAGSTPTADPSADPSVDPSVDPSQAADPTSVPGQGGTAGATTTHRSTDAARPSPHVSTATAEPSPSPSPSSAATSQSSTFAQEVLSLVNQERAGNGCGAVSLNARLTEAAQLHSEDQAEHDTMSHTGSDSSTPWERAERAGYDNAIGENVAYGYRTPEAVMEGWMNSQGHRANILNCAAKAMGVGVAAADDGTLYWTQMFGSVA